MADMLIWRPVLEGMDTLYNVKKHWTLRDLMDCHEILDYRRLCEQQQEQGVT